MDKIEITEGGLVCDNPSCSWEDKTITFSVMDAWVNEPCPKCGENVLTETDYATLKTVINTVNMVNKMSEDEIEDLYESTSHHKELEGITTVRVNTHNGIKMDILKNFTVEYWVRTSADDTDNFIKEVQAVSEEEAIEIVNTTTKNIIKKHTEILVV